MKLFDKSLFSDLSATAYANERQRSHHNIHEDLADPVQRLCVALHRGTYIRPHVHTEQWELMFVLSGAIKMLIFDDQGHVTQQILLSEHGECKGIEIPANCWHTLLPVTTSALFLEVKQGPYKPNTSKSFAAWAPEEGDTSVESFLRWAETAEIGTKYTVED